MKNYFRYMASNAGRWVRGPVGFMIMAWGYSDSSYPRNTILMIVGFVITILAIFNLSLFAPFFGYSVLGKKITGKYGPINGVPGEDPSGKMMAGQKDLKDERGKKATHSF
jgi:hypothetical protein